MPPRNFKWPSQREFTLNDCFPPTIFQRYVEKSLTNAGLDSFDLMQFIPGKTIGLKMTAESGK